MACATVVWGALTGTWFGLPAEALPGLSCGCVRIDLAGLGQPRAPERDTSRSSASSLGTRPPRRSPI
ncbi:MAG: hypothetical protein M0C28_21785 [Candidatus Moduliflexus flocculans]|nr:hypothetical protein [Candidatus Moduliflexus flocculans]